MHRLLLIFLLFTSTVSAQIVACIHDTAKVGFYEFPDTTYYIRNCPLDTSYIIYYDQAKTKVAVHRIHISKNRYDTKTWYRNSQPKRFELNNDSIPYYNKDITSWYPNGHLERQVTTTRDSTIVLSWWSNYKLQTVSRSWGAPWKHEYGHHLFWHGSGVLCDETWYYPDSSRKHNYHDNGEVSWIRIFRRDSTIKRAWFCYSDQAFHPNGAVSRSIVYPAKGRQPCTYYYPSGTRKAECDWMEGNIGPYKEWYESGKIKCEGNYSMGTLYFPNQNVTNYYPTKTGHWIYYNEAGWIEREEWREFDGVVTVKEYNAKSDVISEYQNQVRIDAATFPENYRK